MESWKEVPQLFCNGKFKAKWSDIEWALIGLEYDYGLILHENTHGKTCQRLKGCTLIARPISDMSDDELEKCPNAGDSYYKYLLEDYQRVHARKYLLQRIERLLENKDVFLYLLSMGVYPFDQENPKDVIWRYKNK